MATTEYSNCTDCCEPDGVETLCCPDDPVPTTLYADDGVNPTIELTYDSGTDSWVGNTGTEFAGCGPNLGVDVRCRFGNWQFFIEGGIVDTVLSSVDCTPPFSASVVEFGCDASSYTITVSA